MKNCLVIFLLFLSVSLSAQDRTVKWAAGIGMSLVDVSGKTGFEGEGVNFQIPNLSLLRHINNGFSAGMGVTFTGIPKIKNSFTNQYDFIMIDFFGKYDFNLTEERWVPNLIGGVGLLVKNKYDRASSLNAGVGITYWLFPRIGLNTQAVHRFVPEKSQENFASHTQFSGSLIFTFGESKARRNNRRNGYGFTTNN
jgi:hypothetical protein